jgi:hypothetical protein
MTRANGVSPSHHEDWGQRSIIPENDFNHFADTTWRHCPEGLVCVNIQKAKNDVHVGLRGQLAVRIVVDNTLTGFDGCLVAETVGYLKHRPSRFHPDIVRPCLSGSDPDRLIYECIPLSP